MLFRSQWAWMQSFGSGTMFVRDPWGKNHQGKMQAMNRSIQSCPNMRDFGSGQQWCHCQMNHVMDDHVSFWEQQQLGNKLNA